MPQFYSTLTNFQSIPDDATLNLFSAQDMTAAEVGDVTYLFVAGGFDDKGLSVFSVADDGMLENVSNVYDDETLALGFPSSVTTQVVGETTYLFVGSRADESVSTFSVGDDGSLVNVSIFADTNRVNLQDARGLSTAVIDGVPFLFVAGHADNGISAFLVGEDGNLTNTANIRDRGSSELKLQSPVATTTAKVGETVFVFVAGLGDDGVSVFAYDGGRTFTNVDNVGDLPGLLLKSPLDVVTAEVDGTTYLFVAGAEDNGITVFSVGDDGTLTVASTLRDNANLSLGGVASLSTAVIDGTTYLFGNGRPSSQATNASTDKGLTMLAVGSDGTLTPAAVFAAEDSPSFNSAAQVTTVLVDGTVYVYTAGGQADGLNAFSITPPALDLVDGSDTGVLGDDVTSDTSPTIAFRMQDGPQLRIDWDDGRGFIAIPRGTGATQEITKDIAYESGGRKTITVEARDASGKISSLQLEIEIEALPGDAVPIAVDDDGFSTAFETALSFQVADLLANDQDGAIDADLLLSILSVENASGGTVVLQDDEIIFTPSDDFDGAAGFEYVLSNGVQTDIGEVAITVNEQSGTGLAPIAETDVYATFLANFTTENYTRLAAPQLGNTLLANDVDPEGRLLHVTNINGDAALVSQSGAPKWFEGSNGGEFRVFSNGTVDFRFDPEENAPGSYTTFNYTVSDAAGNQDTARVDLLLQGFANTDTYYLRNAQSGQPDAGPFLLGGGDLPTTPKGALANDVRNATVVAVNGDPDAINGEFGYGAWVDGTQGGQIGVSSEGIVTFRPAGTTFAKGDFTEVLYTIAAPDASGETTTSTIRVEFGNRPEQVPASAQDDAYTVAADVLADAGGTWFRLGSFADNNRVIQNDQDDLDIIMINDNALDAGAFFDGSNGGQFRVYEAGVVDFRNQGDMLEAGEATSFTYRSADGDLATVFLSVDEFLF